MVKDFLSSLRQKWRTIRAKLGERRPTIFHSARLKLTGFYLATILIFSLFLTLSLRGLAAHEFDRAGAGDRGAVRQLFDDYYSVPPQPNSFNRFQTNQSATVRAHLNQDVVLVNLIVLVVGGILSYWYAGRALKPIEQAHETQARFASDASHELRTPLANLKIENEVFLRQKKFSQADAKKLIHSNLEEVQRLESLAGNLLALTQYDTAVLKLEPTNIDMVVASAIENTQKAATNKKIKIEQNLPKAQVLGNADSLTQLLGILLDNAIKYSPAKSTVYLDGFNDNHQYHVSVRDEGPGISQNDLPHIFERLYRGDKSRSGQTQGYGLGLALAQEIAEANEAIITVRNYPGSGAQFVVSLLVAKSK